MNKHLFLIALFFLWLTQFASSQEVKQITKDSENTETRQKFRHWSIAVNGGMSIIDADLSGANKIVPNSKINFAFNTQLEYMITPMWGLYLQYSYLPYGGIRQNVEKFQGLTHDVTLNGTFNILNLFRSNRSIATKWCFNVNVGAGIGFYNTNLYGYLNEEYTNELTDLAVNSRTFVLPVGLSVEYAPIECLGIFFQAEYRMYQADDLDCRVQGRNNDYMGYAGIGLRYKIAAGKKRGSVKTVSIMAHHPDATDRAVKTQSQEIAKLSAKIDNMTDMMNNNIIPKFEAIAKAHEEDNTDSDLDGVPDSRDRHPNTPAGSFVNYYGEPLTEAEINKILGSSVSKPEATIYYELNSYNVTKDSDLAIAQVASKLYNNPNYKAEIVGYCDNSGSDEFNQKLSLKRAETVKNILVKQYGIDANRITIVGKGKTQGPKDKFIVNRRCDVFIVK